MLTLRPYEPGDAAAVLSWIGDERAFRQWSADRYDHYPITPDDLNRRYAAADPRYFLPMTAADETGTVGHLIVRYPDPGRPVVRFGFVIVDSRKRGQGYGRRMLDLAVRYAFGPLGAGRITLGVFENNEPARRCYLAAGFREIAGGEPAYCRIFNEDWQCLEMAMDRPK